MSTWRSEGLTCSRQQSSLPPRVHARRDQRQLNVSPISIWRHYRGLAVPIPEVDIRRLVLVYVGLYVVASVVLCMLIVVGVYVVRVPSPPRGPCIYTYRCPLVQVDLGKPIWIRSEQSLSFPYRTLFILPYVKLLLYPKVVPV